MTFIAGYADHPLGTQLPQPRIWRFSSSDTGLLNFRVARVAILLYERYRAPNWKFVHSSAWMKLFFPMPFVDTDDDVFLGGKSFATWHEALDFYKTLPVHKDSSRGSRRARRTVCPDAGVH
jgi:hypothetical protein